MRDRKFQLHQLPGKSGFDFFGFRFLQVLSSAQFYSVPLCSTPFPGSPVP